MKGKSLCLSDKIDFVKENYFPDSTNLAFEVLLNLNIAPLSQIWYRIYNDNSVHLKRTYLLSVYSISCRLLSAKFLIKLYFDKW